MSGSATVVKTECKAGKGVSELEDVADRVSRQTFKGIAWLLLDCLQNHP